MSRPILPRVGAISGALFVVLLLVSGDGDGTALIVLHLTAFLLFLPFIACLCGVLREAEGGTGWVSGLAFAAAVLGIGVKYGSVAVVIAARDLQEGTAVERAFADVGAAAYMISLLPLALCLGAVAVVALRSHALPRWLAIGSALVAVALAVNSTFIDAEYGPAFLLFLAWTLAASLVLVSGARAERTQRAPAAAVAAS